MNKIITKQQQQQQKSLYSNTSLPADQQMPKEVPVLWLTKESWNAAGSCASSGSTSTQLKVGGCLTRLLPDGPDSSAWITGQRIPSVREELVHRLPAACFFFFFLKTLLPFRDQPFPSWCAPWACSRQMTTHCWHCECERAHGCGAGGCQTEHPQGLNSPG